MGKDKRLKLVDGLCKKEGVPLGRKSLYGRRLSLETATLAAYKSSVVECMRVWRLSLAFWMKVAVEFQFEAVLGKTRCTEF